MELEQIKLELGKETIHLLEKRTNFKQQKNFNSLLRLEHTINESNILRKKVFKVRELEGDWQMICFMKNTEVMQILPSGIRNIIANYISDTWEFKSSDNETNNSKSFLTKTSNKKINLWSQDLTARTVSCKICNYISKDYLFIKPTNDEEYIITNICEDCLRFTVLDAIGLSEYTKILWSIYKVFEIYTAEFNGLLIKLTGINLTMTKIE